MPDLPRGILVKGPKFSSPTKYGLLSVLQPLTPNDVHWEGSGVEWEDFLCGPQVEAFLDFCPPVSGFTKPAQRDADFCHADPFHVKASYDCPPVGRPINESFEIARQRLLNWESYAVEKVFWTGVSANGQINPSLAFGNDTCGITVVNLTPGGGPTDPVGGLATLESALAGEVPNSGIIHVPYGLTPYLANFMLLDRGCDCDPDRWYTPNGNSYVLGSGYPGSGPANVAAAPGTTWMFATGPVAVWRSNIFMVPDDIVQAVNRNVNDVTVFAERTYAVGFSCVVFAVNVRLTCAC